MVRGAVGSRHGQQRESEFHRGERFPAIPVSQRLSWLDRLRGKPDQLEAAVTWTLQSYEKEAQG